MAYGGGLKYDLTSSFYDLVAGAGRKGMTLLRIVGSLRVQSTDATYSVDWAAGIFMAREPTYTPGSFPDPRTDPDTNWMMRWSRTSLPASDSQQTLDLDVRSKRKFMNSDDKVVFYLVNTDSAQQAEVALAGRCLYAMP